MKFSFKLLLWTMIVMALGFGFSGFYFVNYVFQTSMDREVNQAMDESSILRFAFETAALNVPAKYDVLQDTTVSQIASNLESGGRSSGRLLRICDEQKNVLYASPGFGGGDGLLDRTGQDTRTYRVTEQDGAYYIQTGTAVNALDRVLYLETMKDVSEVFRDRSLGFSVYRRVTVAMLLCGTAVMYLIASFLTRPIRLLTRATKRMASGDYHHRARKVSSDELGQLTTDFNQMANALEDNINQLEDEIQTREDFVAAFAHELKTPLTSIINYVNLLKQEKFDDPKIQRYIEVLEEKSQRLKTLTEDVVEASKVSSGNISLEFMNINMIELIQQTSGEFEEKFQTRNLTQIMNFPEEDAIVRVDGRRMWRVLANIYNNAAKYAMEGTRIYADLQTLDGKVIFSLKNISEQPLNISSAEELTERFIRGDLSRSTEGSGLGLSIAKTLTTMMGGTFDLYLDGDLFKVVIIFSKVS